MIYDHYASLKVPTIYTLQSTVLFPNLVSPGFKCLSSSQEMTVEKQKGAISLQNLAQIHQITATTLYHMQ